MTETDATVRSYSSNDVLVTEHDLDGVSDHHGNIFLIELVRYCHTLYFRGDGAFDRKSRMENLVIEQVKNRGGRFLVRLDEDGGRWRNVTYAGAVLVVRAIFHTEKKKQEHEARFETADGGDGDVQSEDTKAKAAAAGGCSQPRIHDQPSSETTPNPTVPATSSVTGLQESPSNKRPPTTDPIGPARKVKKVEKVTTVEHRQETSSQQVPATLAATSEVASSRAESSGSSFTRESSMTSTSSAISSRPQAEDEPAAITKPASKTTSQKTPANLPVTSRASSSRSEHSRSGLVAGGSSITVAKPPSRPQPKDQAAASTPTPKTTSQKASETLPAASDVSSSRSERSRGSLVAGGSSITVAKPPSRPRRKEKTAASTPTPKTTIQKAPATLPATSGVSSSRSEHSRSSLVARGTSITPVAKPASRPQTKDKTAANTSASKTTGPKAPSTPPATSEVSSSRSEHSRSGLVVGGSSITAVAKPTSPPQTKGNATANPSSKTTSQKTPAALPATSEVSTATSGRAPQLQRATEFLSAPSGARVATGGQSKAAQQGIPSTRAAANSVAAAGVPSSALSTTKSTSVGSQQQIQNTEKLPSAETLDGTEVMPITVQSEVSLSNPSVFIATPKSKKKSKVRSDDYVTKYTFKDVLAISNKIKEEVGPQFKKTARENGGNMRLRCLILQYLEAHDAAVANRLERRRIETLVLDSIKENGGRFLKMTQLGRWVILKDAVAMELVSDRFKATRTKRKMKLSEKESAAGGDAQSSKMQQKLDSTSSGENGRCTKEKPTTAPGAQTTMSKSRNLLPIVRRSNKSPSPTNVPSSLPTNPSENPTTNTMPCRMSTDHVQQQAPSVHQATPPMSIEAAAAVEATNATKKAATQPTVEPPATKPPAKALASNGVGQKQGTPEREFARVIPKRAPSNSTGTKLGMSAPREDVVAPKKNEGPRNGTSHCEKPTEALQRASNGRATEKNQGSCEGKAATCSDMKGGHPVSVTPSPAAEKSILVPQNKNKRRGKERPGVQVESKSVKFKSQETKENNSQKIGVVLEGMAANKEKVAPTAVAGIEAPGVGVANTGFSGTKNRVANNAASRQLFLPYCRDGRVENSKASTDISQRNYGNRIEATGKQASTVSGPSLATRYPPLSAVTAASLPNEGTRQVVGGGTTVSRDQKSGDAPCTDRPVESAVAVLKAPSIQTDLRQPELKHASIQTDFAQDRNRRLRVGCLHRLMGERRRTDELLDLANNVNSGAAQPMLKYRSLEDCMWRVPCLSTTRFVITEIAGRQQGSYQQRLRRTIVHERGGDRKFQFSARVRDQSGIEMDVLMNHESGESLFSACFDRGVEKDHEHLNDEESEEESYITVDDVWGGSEKQAREALDSALDWSKWWSGLVVGVEYSHSKYFCVLSLFPSSKPQNILGEGRNHESPVV